MLQGAIERIPLSLGLIRLLVFVEEIPPLPAQRAHARGKQRTADDAAGMRVEADPGISIRPSG